MVGIPSLNASKRLIFCHLAAFSNNKWKNCQTGDEVTMKTSSRPVSMARSCWRSGIGIYRLVMLVVLTELTHLVASSARRCCILFHTRPLLLITLSVQIILLTETRLFIYVFSTLAWCVGSPVGYSPYLWKLISSNH